MKLKTIKYFIAVGCFAFLLSACDKAPLSTTDYITPTDKAFVRIALFSPGTPAVMIKVNDVKVNGNTTPGMIGYFPSTTTFPDYVAVAPDPTIKLSLANTGTQNDSVILFNSKLNLKAGKFYALTLADTGVNRTAFAIEDQFLPQKDSFLSVRLINAMVGSTLTLLRIDSTNSTDVVRDTLAKDIPYQGTSGFIAVKTFTTRPFIRIRIVNSVTGRMYPSPQIPPQTLATGSRRSITYYAYGFENGTSIYAPGLAAQITNQ